VLLALLLIRQWASADRDPARIRERFTAALNSMSSQWKGAMWQSCDPGKGEYKVSAFYAGARATYALEVVQLPGADRTFIAVDPTPPSKCLALAVFYQGQLDTFDYNGSDTVEREELESVSRMLDEALRDAIRK
jgi:hypothetical protein